VRGDPPGPGFDLWSVAVMTVEALTGQPPFASTGAALRSLNRGDLPDWRTVLGGQPGDLVDVLTHALDPSPARRPVTAIELRRLLNSYVEVTWPMKR
jgi:serine/threonine protein kinase